MQTTHDSNMASLTNGNEVKLKMINGDKVGLAPHPHIQVQPQVQQVQPPQAIFILQPPSSVSNQQSMHTFQTVAANAVTTGGAVVANNIAAASNVVPTVTSPVVNHAPRGRKRKKTPSDALAQAAAVAATAKRVKMEQAATGTTPKKSALPSTTTVESATTESEERAIRNSYVTFDGKHVCGECGNALATSWGLDAHIKSVHGKKAFKCDYCEKAFGRKDHLVNHTKSMHTGPKVSKSKQKCSQCGVAVSGKDGMAKHMAEHHPVVPGMYHQCSDCGKNYPTEHACKIHIQQEHTVVSCQECGSLCVGTEGLKRHVAKEHNAKNNIAVASAAAAASAVGRTGKKANSTVSNGMKMQIEIVFKCEFCSGTFSQQSSLDEHIRSFHVDLQCVSCGSSLVGTQAMLTHIQEAHQASKVMFNTGEICYHCEICESTFDRGHLYDEHFLHNHVFCKVGNDLVRPDHLVTAGSSSAQSGQHNMIKPLLTSNNQPLSIVYQCAHCDSLFSDQGQLTKHMDSTHPETFALPTEPLPPSMLAEFQAKDGKAVAGTKANVGHHAGKRPSEDHSQLQQQIFYQCPVCQQLYLDAASLQAHTEEFHKAGGSPGKSIQNRIVVNSVPQAHVASNIVYECDQCKQYFADKSVLEVHINAEHPSNIKGEDKILASSANSNFDEESGFEETKYHQLLMLSDEHQSM